MDYLADNLRFLRKRKSVTQEEMAQALNLKKSTYASYENNEGNTPPAKTLHAIGKYFNISMESLFEVSFTALKDQQPLKISDHEIYFPVSVDLEGTELIDVVPYSHRAQAGYLQDYSNPSYIQSLPKINWDLGAYEAGTKRIFQISGDSMLPVPSQSFVLGVKKEYLELIDNRTYILITKHDILFKRIRKEGPYLHLISDNSIYPPQKIEADEVRQYWMGLKVIMDIPEQTTLTLDDISSTLAQTKEKVEEVLGAVKKL